MTIHDFEHKLLGLIDSMVATATDDELFAGGYLRGHISLAVARAELEGKTPLGYVPGTMVPAEFGNVMGGYQAG